MICPVCKSDTKIMQSKLGTFTECTNCSYSRRHKPSELPSPQEKSDDVVNHPSHYCSHPSGVECITITRHHDFAVGNAIKYMWRAGLKDSSKEKEVEDLRKAVWYLTDRISQLEGSKDES